MDKLSANNCVEQVANLRDYFRRSVEDVIDNRGVDMDPHAAHYVVNLLTSFSRSEALYEDDGESYGLKPLALMLADAANASSAEERSQSLQRIGDVSLFVSGFFSNSLARTAVDIDYYINMGGNAYAVLSEEVRGTFRGNAFAPIYQELSEKFLVLIDILNEVRDSKRIDSDVDLLRTYQQWLKTGSRRCEKLLRKQGVVPISQASKYRH
ncbi:MAG: hypothetical protein GY763_05400 [Gammaproteobacteria bacterium]|nr:hypothetical protein [Gammaproteobacteria bacterium]